MTVSASFSSTGPYASPERPHVPTESSETTSPVFPSGRCLTLRVLPRSKALDGRLVPVYPKLRRASRRERPKGASSDAKVRSLPLSLVRARVLGGGLRRAAPAPEGPGAHFGQGRHAASSSPEGGRARPASSRPHPRRAPVEGPCRHVRGDERARREEGRCTLHGRRHLEVPRRSGHERPREDRSRAHRALRDLSGHEARPSVRPHEGRRHRDPVRAHGHAQGRHGPHQGHEQAGWLAGDRDPVVDARWPHQGGARLLGQRHDDVPNRNLADEGPRHSHARRDGPERDGQR